MRAHLLLFIFIVLASFRCFADPTLCATAQVQLSQNATLDRQAFVATMTITDGLPVDLSNIAVTVNFTDANGNPVTDNINNPNTPNPVFFIELNKGSVIPASIASGGSATISWLIIPTLSAGVTTAAYNVGAQLSYTANGQPYTIAVTPAPITVGALPDLVLDYFLPAEVYGDNPLTPQVEPSIPFSFGLRAKNTGAGVANNFQINSGAPNITANQQGFAKQR